MWKFAVRFIQFSITAILIYILLFGLLFFLRIHGVPLIYSASQGNVFEGGVTYKKFREFNKDEKYDVIILGSSHAYRGYNPGIFEQYGLKMYNLGSRSQSMIGSYVIARNYISSENCKTVIIDVYDRIFKSTSIESISDMVQNLSSDAAAFSICSRSNDPRSINLFTLRMFSKFSDPLNLDTAGIYKGFQGATGQLRLPGNPNSPWYESNNQSIRYFNKLIRYLYSQRIKVIVAEHPLPGVYPIVPVSHQKFVDDITPVMKKYNVPFYDFMYDTTMTGIQYFSDENHLSWRGVNKYNHSLISRLIEDGHLTVSDDMKHLNNEAVNSSITMQHE
jgi:hypothetical protein